MQIFKVGGCVRDMLLGIDSRDIDYVVVDASIDDMLNKGFSQVGNDFPVFLHPETGEEYALARVERKVGVGYTGFVCSTDNVSLEDDLMRRDFTINSMALAEDGSIIDPFNGQSDLQAGIIKHTSEAFAEDPVRIFRGCRFAGRYNFTVASETLALMKQLVDQDEVEAMTKDRIYLEFVKMLDVSFFVKSVKLLDEVGVIDRMFSHSVDYEMLSKVENSQSMNKSMFRLAILARNESKQWMQDYKFSSEWIEFIVTWQKVRDQLKRFDSLSAEEKLDLFEKGDILRRPERFDMIVELNNLLNDQNTNVHKYAVALKSAVTEDIIASIKDKKSIKDVVKSLRLSAIKDI